MAVTDNACDADVVSFLIDARYAGERLDKALARLIPAHSRTRLQAWISQGFVLVNGEAASVKRIVLPGDRLTVTPQAAPEDLAFSPEDVAFTVVAESPDWIVLDKPAGLVTHPGAGNWQGTLLNGLLYRYPELARVARAGIVHRLDKDTSGLLVVARTEAAQTHLVRQLQARTVARHYLALAHGHLHQDVTLNAPIGRDPKVPVRMSATHAIAAKPAVTHVVSERLGSSTDGQPVTQIQCRLETGRTHQIRVHLSVLGHPLLGDALYGGRAAAGATRHMLHAQALRFQDPRSAQTVSFTAPLPGDMVAVQDAIVWTP